MTTPTTADIERTIARDLDQCDLGLALTTGATRRKYLRQRKACFAGLRELNRRDGLDNITQEELVASLSELDTITVEVPTGAGKA